MSKKTPSSNIVSETLEFDGNSHLSTLYGAQNIHLRNIEESTGVTISSRSNTLMISGAEDHVDLAKTAINALWERIQSGFDVTPSDVTAAIRFASHNLEMEEAKQDLKKKYGDTEHTIATTRKIISARTPTQAAYIEALQEKPLIFGVGPAGTGKTYMAVAAAVSMFTQGQIERIIMCRPAVEAGESLGFLPGDMKDKVDPYLRPIYDALYDMLPHDKVTRCLENDDIEIAPIAFMRGRTLNNAFVILDEAQNTSRSQMKMVLTRLGENSRMVVTGDPSQVDLPKGQISGLTDALDTLKHLDGKDAAIVRFSDKDVVRHSLVSKIIRAYDKAKK